MTPYYSENGITIYNADCREILPSLPKVDLVLTDPPYGMNYKSGWSTAAVTYDGVRSSLRMYREVVPQVASLMSENSHCYWFTRWDVLSDTCDLFAPHLGVANALVWDKGHPGMGDLSLYGFSYEMVVFAIKGKRALVGGRPNNIFRFHPVPASKRQHPTEKPIELIQDWLRRSSAEAECVLDLFAGSGSTLIAAKALSRRAIGIEIEERYCEIAANRLRQEVLQFGSRESA